MKQEITKITQKKQSNPIVVQNGNKGSWWSSLTDKQRKVINTTAIILGISTISLIALYFGVRVGRKVISKNEEGKSFGKDKSATWAKQFKNAFDNNGWWGTNEELIRTTLIEIPSQEDFNKVKKSYSKIYKGESLIKTLTDELKDTEYDEMLAIVSAKPKSSRDAKKGVKSYDPKGWATRVYSAVSYEWLGVGWGTDLPALNAVFNEFPTQKAFKDTAIAYKKKYGSSLLADVKGDVSYAEYLGYKSKIYSLPSD